MGWFNALSGMMKQTSTSSDDEPIYPLEPWLTPVDRDGSPTFEEMSKIAQSNSQQDLRDAWVSAQGKKKNTRAQIKGWMDTAFPAYQEQFNKTLADYDNWSGDAETAKRSTNSQMSQFLAQTGQGGQSNSAQMMARIAGALQNAKLEEARRTLQMDKLNLMRQNFGELFGYASSLSEMFSF